MKKIVLDISPEGTAFKEKIISFLTKTVLSESEHSKMLSYIDSGIEVRKFDGKGTDGVLGKLGITSCGCYFQVSEHSGHKLFEFDSGNEDGPIIMYIHGGAYVFGYTDIYFRFNEALATNCKAKVVAPIYGLANSRNKGAYKEAYELLVSTYLALAGKGRPVYIMGDSSGGAMALRLGQILKERNLPMPTGLILISPFVDASLKDPVEGDLLRRDITLDPYGLRRFAELWAGGTDLSDPDISPLYGDMKGLPKTMVVTGTDEIFLPSNESLAEKIERSGGDVELVECNGSYHIFPVYTELPESKKVMDLICGFCRSE